MLKNSFVHIQGIGSKTEQRIWASGVHSWHDFIPPFPLNISQEKAELISRVIDESLLNIAENPLYFCKMLPASQHWRIFPHFKPATVYLDIETTGLGKFSDHITTIALYDGQLIKHYIYGENLNDFVDDIQKYKLLVTYNGKTFDIPFIENFFGIRLNKAHIDLRYILHSLGYKGGLKGCEKQFGLNRGELAGVDGFFAVILWSEYKRSGNRNFLETLLAYNIEDVVNLELLMHEAYNLNLQKTPFYDELRLDVPPRPDVPFSADIKIVERIKNSLGF